MAPADAGAIPVPVSGTVCGLPAALSVTLTVADRAPVVVGVNVTLMVQLVPAASVEPQPFVCEKSPGFDPARAMLEIFSVADPVLVKTTDWDRLEVPVVCVPKDKLVGANETAGAPDVPVPVSATLCGLPAALSLMLTAADRAAATVGVKVTLMLQAAPGITMVQLFVCEKSPGLVPVSETPAKKPQLPVLVSVMVRAALPVPTF